MTKTRNNNFKEMLERLDMQSILILGKDGFIGSELFNYLNDDLVTGTNKTQCDITQKSNLISLISKTMPDVIINCTGLLSKSFKDRYDVFKVNYDGVKNLLDVCYELGYKGKIILLGSSEMNNSDSVYGVSKKCAFDYATLMNNNTKLHIVTLVPSIVYGENQKGNMFIPSMVKAYKKGKIFEMSSGYQQRNFVHVDDIISAIEILINTDKDFKELGHYLPLHYPTDFTLRQVTEIFNKVTKKEFSFAYHRIPMRDGETEIFENLGFISYIKIGWNPRVTLEEGLKRCIQ